MIVFLAVILFVLSGCEKQQPESESVDSIPTINIGISARTGLSKNLSEVNQTLGDLTEEKIGVRARLIWTGLNSSQGNSYYKNRQLGVDILNIYFNQFENYRQKNLLLDMEPYMAEAPALQEVLDEKTDLKKGEMPWSSVPRSPIYWTDVWQVYYMKERMIPSAIFTRAMPIQNGWNWQNAGRRKGIWQKM